MAKKPAPKAIKKTKKGATKKGMNPGLAAFIEKKKGGKK